MVSRVSGWVREGSVPGRWGVAGKVLDLIQGRLVRIPQHPLSPCQQFNSHLTCTHPSSTRTLIRDSTRDQHSSNSLSLSLTHPSSSVSSINGTNSDFTVASSPFEEDVLFFDTRLRLDGLSLGASSSGSKTNAACHGVSGAAFDGLSKTGEDNFSFSPGGLLR